MGEGWGEGQCHYTHRGGVGEGWGEDNVITHTEEGWGRGGVRTTSSHTQRRGGGGVG